MRPPRYEREAAQDANCDVGVVAADKLHVGHIDSVPLQRITQPQQRRPATDFLHGKHIRLGFHYHLPDSGSGLRTFGGPRSGGAVKVALKVIGDDPKTLSEAG